MDALPTPPERVRLVYADGTEIPLEVVYAGTSPDGHFHWQAVLVAVAPPGSHIAIGMLPAKTEVSVILRVSKERP